MAVASVRFGEPIGGWLIGIALVAIGGVTVVMFGGGANGELQLRGDLLALAAMVAKWPCITHITSARQEAHLLDSLASVDVDVTAEELEEIYAQFAAQQEQHEKETAAGRAAGPSQGHNSHTRHPSTEISDRCGRRRQIHRSRRRRCGSTTERS